MAKTGTANPLVAETSFPRYQLPTKSSISWTFFVTLQINLHDEFLSKIIKFLKIPMQPNND